MTALARYLTSGTFVALCTLAGCNTTTSLPDVAQPVRQALTNAGLKDVTVSQNREKGMVTLGGHVTSEGERAQAELIAKPIASGQVLAVEIAVVPLGAERDARAINTDVDQGIESNLSAALTSKQLQHNVKFSVKNAVVTLTGDVDSQDSRALAEQAAMAVPYVKQVVNTLQVKNQKATSSK